MLEHWPEDVGALDEPSLLRQLVLCGGKVPVQQLNAVSSRVETLSSSTAPRTLSQKRVFITDWMDKQMARNGTAADAARSPPPPQSPDERDMAPAATPARAAAATLTQTEAELLERIATARAGGTSIPTQEVPPLCSAVVELLGQPRSPLTLSARRCLIDDWFTEAQQRLSRPSLSRQQLQVETAVPCDSVPCKDLFESLSEVPAALLEVPMPEVSASELTTLAAQVHAISGVAPCGDSEAELQAFVCDWYRWEFHVRLGRGLAGVRPGHPGAR